MPPTLATFGGSVGKKPIYILRTPSFTLRCFSSAAAFSCWSSFAHCFSSSSTAYRKTSKTVCWKPSTCGDMLRKMHLPLTSIHKHHKSTVVNPFQTGLHTRCLYSLGAFPPQAGGRFSLPPQWISVVLCWKDYRPPPFKNSPSSLED